jgi:hypothetical protein
MVVDAASANESFLVDLSVESNEVQSPSASLQYKASNISQLFFPTTFRTFFQISLLLVLQILKLLS